MSLWNVARNPEILLAEGDIDMAALMEIILKREGAMVDVACTGKQAVEYCRLTKYDVVILAVNLPDTDSLKVFQQLRRSGSDAPVIFLTYHDEPPTKQRRLKDLGVVQHLTKPFDVEELEQSVVTALRHRTVQLTVQLKLEAGKSGVLLGLSDSVHQPQPYPYRIEDVAKLRQSMQDRFDLEEVRTLCFDLGVDYDSLRGEGKAANVRELLAVLIRQERLHDLVQHPFMKERGLYLAIRRNASGTA